MWYDEAISFLISRLPLSQLLLATGADNHPPLYFLLISHLPAFLLPLLSLVSFLLCWPLVYLLGRYMATKRVAQYAVLIFAVNPLLLYFATQIRMYSLAVLIHLLVICCLVLTKNRLYFLCCLAGLYTHYFFLVSLVSITVLKPAYLKINLVAFLCFLPWLVFVFSLPHPTPWNFPVYISLPAAFMSFTLGGLGATTLRTMLGNQTPFLFRLFVILVSAWSIKKLLGSPLYITRLFWLNLAFSLPVFSPRSLVLYVPVYSVIVAARLNLWKALSLSLALSLIYIYFYRIAPDTWSAPLSGLKHQLAALPPGSAVVHTSPYTYFPTLANGFPANHHFLFGHSGLTDITEKLLQAQIITASPNANHYTVKVDLATSPVTISLE